MKKIKIKFTSEELAGLLMHSNPDPFRDAHVTDTMFFKQHFLTAPDVQ